MPYAGTIGEQANRGANLRGYLTTALQQHIVDIGLL
jgi:hypothetical protein